MMMDVSKNEPSSKNGATQQECAGCGKTITERLVDDSFILKKERETLETHDNVENKKETS